MKNMFDIRHHIRCDVCNKITEKRKDSLTQETVYICRNCYSLEYNGYPVYDQNGLCIGVARAFEQNR